MFEDNFPYDKKSLTYVSYDYKNKVCLVDGNQVEKIGTGGSFSANGYGFGVYSYSNCDMYSIRLYSQPLSASAKIANYAIDKARFDLA